MLQTFTTCPCTDEACKFLRIRREIHSIASQKKEVGVKEVDIFTPILHINVKMVCINDVIGRVKIASVSNLAPLLFSKVRRSGPAEVTC